MSDLFSSEIFQPEPSVSIGRSKFDGLSHKHTTDLTEGKLCPIYLEEVIPGDTFTIKTSTFVRMSTPVFPVMDNAVLDVWWFYVPTRLVWNKAKEFYGENTSAPWVQEVEYTVPQITFKNHFVDDTGNGYCVIHRGSLMNRLGIPTTLFPGTSVSNPQANGYFLSVSDLPNRCYRLIWNEFFRDQNVDFPVPFYTDSVDRAYNNSNEYGSEVLNVNKLHDYFTNCLPGPQKSLQPVPASLLASQIPVQALVDNQSFTSRAAVDILHFAHASGTNNWLHTSTGSKVDVSLSPANDAKGATGSTSDPGLSLTPDNLYAVIPSDQVATVNTLRQAFAVQRVLELQARSGSRYREILSSFFNVTIPDLTAQVPEYLGGSRVPINIDQVLQTSSTDSVSPQGNTAGYSLTTDVDDSFTKSFIEPGYLIGLATVRVLHTYPGQCRPFWFRKRRYDFYYPQFANLSEQPVFKKYLNTTGIDEIDNQVFGYQAAWEDMRQCPNQLSGQYSPICYNTGATVDDTIIEEPSPLASAWTFSDFYKMYYEDAVNREAGTVPNPQFILAPTLSSSWMKEGNGNVNQVLAVPDDVQFLADFYFDVKAIRPLPITSIPGLIDHH